VTVAQLISRKLYPVHVRACVCGCVFLVTRTQARIKIRLSTVFSQAFYLLRKCVSERVHGGETPRFMFSNFMKLRILLAVYCLMKSHLNESERLCWPVVSVCR
jgi:hypothetical protein